MTGCAVPPVANGQLVGCVDAFTGMIADGSRCAVSCDAGYEVADPLAPASVFCSSGVLPDLPVCSRKWSTVAAAVPAAASC